MQSDRQDDDGQEIARKQLRLLMMRVELTEARADRMVRSCAEEADRVREAGTDQQMLDHHALRTGAILAAERMLQSALPTECDLGMTLTRFVTHALIASDRITELRTSAGCVLVGGEVCRWIMLVAAELMHVVETCAAPDDSCSARVHLDHLARGIVMSVTSVGGARWPVPSKSGSDAFNRADRLMKLFGELSRTVCGDDVVYEATFEGGRVSAGS